jgi:calcium-dependent protein kinase
LKKFHHANIVKFIDLIETQNHIYIITEYCRDGDLKEMLSHKKLSEQEGTDFIR